MLMSRVPFVLLSSKKSAGVRRGANYTRVSRGPPGCRPETRRRCCQAPGCPATGRLRRPERQPACPAPASRHGRRPSTTSPHRKGLTRPCHDCYREPKFFPARWTAASAESLGGCFLRAIVFIDGQNLYHLARRAWASGPQSPYAWPSYDVEKLAGAFVARTPGRLLAETRFYTGVPDPNSGRSELFWHGFWSNKIRYLKSQGVYVYRGRVNAGGQGEGRRCQPRP